MPEPLPTARELERLDLKAFCDRCSARLRKTPGGRVWLAQLGRLEPQGTRTNGAVEAAGAVLCRECGESLQAWMAADTAAEQQ